MPARDSKALLTKTNRRRLRTNTGSEERLKAASSRKRRLPGVFSFFRSALGLPGACSEGGIAVIIGDGSNQIAEHKQDSNYREKKEGQAKSPANGLTQNAAPGIKPRGTIN